MRIAMLELLAYGPFRGLTFDLSMPGIHVIFGRNEAGKSTTLRAITGLLYGIDAKTPDAHVHKFADLRIGGVLENARGERIRVVRRKGNTNTLLDERDLPLDESKMKKLLGGVSKESFIQAFGLTHDALLAGAQALLEGRGDLGESLFDASIGGGGEVQRLVAELKAEADRIYKPRGSALPLNDALKSFAEAQKSIREKESRPEAFLEQERGLIEVTNEREACIKAKVELTTRRARLERARRRVPLERRFERAMERHKELGGLADHSERIDALKERFAAYRQAVSQRRVFLAEAERLTERVTEAARRAGIDTTGHMEPLRTVFRTESRIHALLRDRARLASSMESARAEIAKQERELARLGEVAKGSASRVCSAGTSPGAELVMALERARGLGEIETRLATKRAQVERKKRELQAQATADGLFDGTLDEFASLRVPAVATVERLESRVEAIEGVLSRSAERITELEKEASSIERQIACHSGDFAPPDVAALHAARAARDDAWRALLAAESDRHSAEIEVERHLREADAVADRMIREADRVTTLARLRSEAETDARHIQKLQEERSRSLAARTALDGELAALFADAGVVPPHTAAFAEMREWLARHAQIRDAFATLREADEEAIDDAQKLEASRHELQRALAATRGDIDVDGLSLTALIAAGAQRLSAIEALRRAEEDAARTMTKLHAELDERLTRRERDEAVFAEVSAKLAALVTPLGVAADASDDEVNRSVTALHELFGLVDKRADAEARARGFDAQVRDFEMDLARVIGELAPDLASMDPVDGAARLFAGGAEARENAQELSRVTRELEVDGEISRGDAERALLTDADAAERRLEELSEQIDEMDADITRLTERIGGIRSGLERMRADSNAAEAASAAQQRLARVREHSERWCRAKLAAHVLSREIERYREEHQGPLLKSSSGLFSRLTLGSFAGIKAAFDDRDRPCLRCVRADGTTEVDVSGLSDGTRDQLYLSLRLASLLVRAEVAEPMPLVLDDVLIQLDDQRASAALRVLAEVSRRMQVLFFTHHARLVDLARASVSDDELVVHELANGPGAFAPD